MVCPCNRVNDVHVTILVVYVLNAVNVAKDFSQSNNGVLVES